MQVTYDISWQHVTILTVCPLFLQVCNTWNRSSITSKKQLSTDFLANPTQFALARVYNLFKNTPPIIRYPNMTLRILEDVGIKTSLKYVDKESDKAEFKLLSSQSLDLGTVSLSRNGLLTFSPCENCFGTILVTYEVVEIGIINGKPLSADGAVSIVITPVEDSPTLYFRNGSSSSYVDVSDSNRHVTLSHNQNITGTTDIGIRLLILDPDPDDHLYFAERKANVGTLSLQSIPDMDSQLVNQSSHILQSTFKTADFILSLPGNFTGETDFGVIGYDQNGSYTDVLTVTVKVLHFPCLNGGRCYGNETDAQCTRMARVRSWDGYYCNCSSGFTGEMCESKIDECLSSPCRPWSTCEAHLDHYRCACPAGYTGEICDINVDECASSPCRDNHTCTDHINSYSCVCPPGYTGLRCDSDVDHCASSPCSYNRTCIDGINSFSCACSSGYTGLHCEVDVDDCTSDPCPNNHTCIDRINSYSCVCSPGYTGTYCDNDVDECASSPCPLNLTCINQIQSYSCACPAGFTGVHCATDINECASTPCPTGNRCEDHDNGYVCVSSLHDYNEGSGQTTLLAVILTVLGLVTIAVVGVVIYFCYRSRHRSKYSMGDQTSLM